MLFPEVLAEVLRLTSRPDKEASAIVAINRAITLFTLKGDFKRDLVEASLPVNPLLYGDTISIAGLTRFRKFRYVKPTAVKYYLDPIGEEQVFINQAVLRNKYYIAGTSMIYTLSALTAALEISYLTYPPVLDSGTNASYWMLDMIPYAVIDMACSEVFKVVGDDASAKRYYETGMDLYNTLKGDLAL